ncbi:uncharacterized protein LOC144446370 [Glandiceps talaboti]
MDSFDFDSPDIPMLKSSSIEFQARPERYQITEAAPSHEPSPQYLKQVFDFGWLMKKHPHKYQSLVDKHMEETGTEAERKYERSVSNDDQKLAKKRNQRLTSEKTFSSSTSTSTSTPTPTQSFAKRSSSYANIHDMKKSLPQDEKQRELYLKELNRELVMGRDAYVYDNDIYDETTGSTEYIMMGRRNSSFVPLPTFEEEFEITSETLHETSELELTNNEEGSRRGSVIPPVDDFTSASSDEQSPVPSPKVSLKLRSRHELSGENMNCVPVELQPDRKRLFGVGPVYQPPSEQVCVQQDEAKQLNLLQRIIQRGFTATSNTSFPHQEDATPLPPDPQNNETALDSTQSIKEKFLSRSEMNFLSPSSM